jgi:PilZ domain
MAARPKEALNEAEAAFVEKRSEPRFEGLVERAALTFRGADHIVPVINISSRGTMIESALEPRLGESVSIRFEGCSPIYAFVRWIREGRIGLNFGCELTLG